MRQVRSYLGRLGARSQLYAGDDKVTEFGIALVVVDTPSSAICGGILGLHYGCTVCCSGGRDSGVTLAATSSVSSRKCTLKTSVGSEITNNKKVQYGVSSKDRDMNVEYPLKRSISRDEEMETWGDQG